MPAPIFKKAFVLLFTLGLIILTTIPLYFYYSQLIQHGQMQTAKVNKKLSRFLTQQSQTLKYLGRDIVKYFQSNDYQSIAAMIRHYENLDYFLASNKNSPGARLIWSSSNSDTIIGGFGLFSPRALAPDLNYYYHHANPNSKINISPAYMSADLPNLPVIHIGSGLFDATGTPIGSLEIRYPLKNIIQMLSTHIDTQLYRFYVIDNAQILIDSDMLNNPISHSRLFNSTSEPDNQPLDKTTLHIYQYHKPLKNYPYVLAMSLKPNAFKDYLFQYKKNELVFIGLTYVVFILTLLFYRQWLYAGLQKYINLCLPQKATNKAKWLSYSILIRYITHIYHVQNNLKKTIHIKEKQYQSQLQSHDLYVADQNRELANLKEQMLLNQVNILSSKINKKYAEKIGFYLGETLDRMLSRTMLLESHMDPNQDMVLEPKQQQRLIQNLNQDLKSIFSLSPTEPKPSQIDLATLVDNAIDINLITSHQKQMNIMPSFHDLQKAFASYELQLFQIVASLIYQRIHNTPKGGKIIITAEQLETKQGKIFSLEICDNGYQQDTSQHQKHIWPFFDFRLLHWDMVLQLINAMNGHIKEIYQPYQGNHLKLKIPEIASKKPLTTKNNILTLPIKEIHGIS